MRLVCAHAPLLTRALSHLKVRDVLQRIARVDAKLLVYPTVVAYHGDSLWQRDEETPVNTVDEGGVVAAGGDGVGERAVIAAVYGELVKHGGAMVSDVCDVVREFDRVAVLWDEKWVSCVPVGSFAGLAHICAR